MRVAVRLTKSEELESVLEDSGVDLMDYASRYGRYRMRIKPSELKEYEDLLRSLFRRSKEESES